MRLSLCDQPWRFQSLFAVSTRSMVACRRGLSVLGEMLRAGTLCLSRSLFLRAHYSISKHHSLAARPIHICWNITLESLPRRVIKLFSDVRVI